MSSSVKAVFVYRPKQETEVFDQADQVLPIPAFANGLIMTVGEIFGWLLE